MMHINTGSEIDRLLRWSGPARCPNALYIQTLKPVFDCSAVVRDSAPGLAVHVPAPYGILTNGRPGRWCKLALN